MKYYTLTAVINGDEVRFNKVFASRNQAIDYMFNYCRKINYFNMEVEDEYCIGDNKHDIEYVCDYYNRFRVTRCLA